ncbi:mitogen-activated protein kinase kinase kinase 18-like [Dioscorea cayenensis subsp. rotundata]|uniref:Mitogen-activated protein kinase kinase kinase 18-like n=1 Tax=Dioscorea cayennensis subsp. rotundata TaxID=55577 RepID=A0AB40BPR4_DIOCR|nr:mitogen-activated protein kinase kinase kinase 18-like [Dioscorea cayenensis subsp. rotundata]
MVMDNTNKRNWRRGSCIGKGSFGAVYLAAGDGDSPVFAVKTVACSTLSSCKQSTAMAALENEIQIVRSISSPYIVSYLGDDVTKEPKLGGECRNLHLEYMVGGTVAKRSDRIDESEIKAYTRCVVRGLHYLHTVAGVVHGDVKGENVLVGAVAGVAKLADFGSSRRINGEKDEEVVVGGTPLWMAPEVARGERQRVESDVWSLGCMVIEMVSGGRPWGKGWGEGEEVGKVMYRIGYGEEVPEMPAGMSVEGRDFVGKCLRREVGERWSCEELLKHGFLREGDRVPDGPSPRSVFEWGSVLEFEEGRSGWSSEDEEDEEVVIGLVRERVRELAEEGEGGGWEMMISEEGWEVVRGGEGECGGSGDCRSSVLSCSCYCYCYCSFSFSLCCCCCCCCCWDGWNDFGDELLWWKTWGEVGDWEEHFQLIEDPNHNTFFEN